ncbi:MAG: phosphomannomutase/phosphoglucomutase [Alphaproteobacteria bacterium]|nr:phosphomannomutase/phosphoglucomutase [Alphaproteobacteria bacterium]
MSAAHRFDPSILRQYDIRGVVGRTITARDAEAIGHGFATIVQRDRARPKICLGYDGRLSSPELQAAVARGLNAGGAEVIRVGLGPTPLLYYSVHKRSADGGIMVTGSHNPPDFNGFKMMIGTRPFFGDAIQELGRLVAAGELANGTGSVLDVALLDDYVARLVQDFEPGRTLTIAWDAGNGATGEAVERLTKQIPGRHHLLFTKIDGTFPSHHPDPTVPENLEALIRTVRDQSCDLGIAFDGDGDRIGVVDSAGRILWGDQLMAIFAADVLRTRPGATIIADVKASQVLFDEIARLGGKPLMWRTGHSLIKNKMKETGAPLAGEMSGHIFFADRYYGFDDALYAAIRLISIVAGAKKSLASMRNRLPQVVNTPEIRFDCDDTRKFTVVEEVRNRLRSAGAKVSDLDGVRVSSGRGWWLLRASNTQPVLVARCEGPDAAALDSLKQELVTQLRASGIHPPAF